MRAPGMDGSPWVSYRYQCLLQGTWLVGCTVSVVNTGIGGYTGAAPVAWLPSTTVVSDQ
jgi:hypothetical protein